MKKIAVGIALVCSAAIGYVVVDGPRDSGGPGSYQELVRQRDGAEQTLKAQGAALERKNFGIAEAWAVNLSKAEVSDETFEALESLGSVAELDLTGTAISDEQLKRLSEPKIGGFLVRVNLSNTAVSDLGIDALAGASYLRELDLTGTKVTEAGLREWQKKRDAHPYVQRVFKKVKVTR